MDIRDASRQDVIEQYRERIALGKRIRLYKTEFEVLVDGFIDTLSHLEQPDAIQKVCRDEMTLLEEGYPQLTLASDYIPRYRKAISQAVATQQLPPSKHQYLHHERLTGLPQQRDEHWALTFFKYSPAEYEQLDHRQAQTNRNRLLNLQKVNPWRYLDTLNELLSSTEKFAARHHTIAIVGFTGRRFGEVVARGQFSLTPHPYLLHFEGQQKQKREHQGYDIITLMPAESVLQHLEQLREMPEVKPLMALEGADLKRAVNQFDVQVNRECDKYLMKTGVMPPLQGKAHVTIHNLRSLWGAIATFFFCPPSHHEYAFLQHYLGHILESSATGHYFRYMLVDDQDNLLRDKGIKLQDVPELPLLDQSAESEDEGEQLEFAMADEPEPDVDPSQTHPSKTTTARKAAMGKQSAAQQDWLQQMEQVQNDLRSEFAEQLATFKQETDTELSTLRRQVQSTGPGHLLEQIEALEAENQSLTAERDQLKAELQQTQAKTEALATHLKEAQAKLDRFRQLLLGNDDPSPSPATIPSKVSASSKAQADRPITDSPKPVPPRKRGRAPGKAAQRAQVIFDALRAWNGKTPTETLAFSPGLLESVFRVHRKAAKAFCQEFQNEIEDHHAEIGVEWILTHNKGKDIEGFKAFVSEFQ
ncbi:MAG: protelomerase family protein [Thermosynechococcaceae cyanobacterium]